MINVALIGFGVSGQVFHAPTITSVHGLNLKKIYTTSSEKKEKAIKEYQGVEVVNDLNNIWLDESIDLVVVATPNNQHYEFAKVALNYGKHVVVEKPFTIESKEAEELIKLAEEKKLVLSVYHNRRWDSDFLTVKKIIHEGKLGNLVEYEAHFDRFRNYFKEGAWREKNVPGSGILYDLGAHLIDQATNLFGCPKKVFGDVRIQRQGGDTIDNFEVILYYPNLKVTLKAGMLVREELPHFILLGDKGSFIKYGMDIQEGKLRDGIRPVAVSDFGVEPKELYGTIHTEINGEVIREKVVSEVGDYTSYYKNILNTIKGEEELVVKPEEARDTIRIIELAIKSSNEGRIEEFN